MNPSIATTVFLTLALSAAACSKSDNEAEPSAQKPVSPTESPDPTPTETQTPDQPAADDPATAAAPATADGAPLREGQTVRHSWDESPSTTFAWTAGSETIQIELVVPEDGDGDGTLRATVAGKSHDVTAFTYDVARGGSGFQLTALPSGQLEAVFEYGGAGAEPGSITAYLIAFDSATGKVEIAKGWMGEETDERPPWDKLAGKKQAEPSADPCYTECLKNGPDDAPGAADDWRKMSKDDQAARCEESCAGGEPPPVEHEM